jgi:hypothetical protein
MRGRLLFPFVADLALYQTAGTQFDTVFREPVGPRTERFASLPCQVEVGEFGTLEQAFSGDLPKTDLILVFHYRDLELLNLVDPATGQVVIQVNDRLDAIRDRQTKEVQPIKNPPGLYAAEVRPIAFGFGTSRNLLLVTFHDRTQGRLRA